MLTGAEALDATGIDAVALKPSESAVEEATELPLDRVTIDYEGSEHVPSRSALAMLAEDLDVRVTASVRADGFDPFGNDRLYDRLPLSVSMVLVAGHPAFLSPAERDRAIAPRLGAALDRSPDAWVGTEGIERLALATGATQFELLSPTTEADIRGLRDVGFSGEIAVYAPTVLAADETSILDAVGGYVARRPPIRRRLSETARTDGSATGGTRSLLLAGSHDYALIGGLETVKSRVASLKAAGTDYVVGYPARGLGAFTG